MQESDSQEALRAWSLNQNLLDAVSKSHPDEVIALLDLGASVICSDKLGNTALHRCAMVVAEKEGNNTNFVQIAKALIMHGAEPNLENNDGKTVYELCPTDPWKQLIDGFVARKESIKSRCLQSAKDEALSSTALDQSSTAVLRVSGADEVAVPTPKEQEKIVFLSQ